MALRVFGVSRHIVYATPSLSFDPVYGHSPEPICSKDVASCAASVALVYMIMTWQIVVGRVTTRLHMLAMS